MFFRSAPCLGVKNCPKEECTHVVAIRDRRNCPKHNVLLIRSNDCPVQFLYIHPKDKDDGRRWIGGLVRCQKSSSENLHNHKINAPSKMAQ